MMQRAVARDLWATGVRGGHVVCLRLPKGYDFLLQPTRLF